MLLHRGFMKTKILVLLLITSAFFLIGCACTSCNTQDPARQQINAVRKMSFESNRKTAYLSIAQRPDLSDTAQVQLVKAVFDTLEFDDSKKMVLLALIENPSFSENAETAILKRLNGVSFDNTKANILMAIDAVHTLRNIESTEPVTTK